jgi:hypothetical protein
MHQPDAVGWQTNDSPILEPLGELSKMCHSSEWDTKLQDPYSGRVYYQRPRSSLRGATRTKPAPLPYTLSASAQKIKRSNSSRTSTETSPIKVPGSKTAHSLVVMRPASAIIRERKERQDKISSVKALFQGKSLSASLSEALVTTGMASNQAFEQEHRMQLLLQQYQHATNRTSADLPPPRTQCKKRKPKITKAKGSISLPSTVPDIVEVQPALETSDRIVTTLPCVAMDTLSPLNVSRLQQQFPLPELCFPKTEGSPPTSSQTTPGSTSRTLLTARNRLSANVYFLAQEKRRLYRLRRQKELQYMPSFSGTAYVCMCIKRWIKRTRASRWHDVVSKFSFLFEATAVGETASVHERHLNRRGSILSRNVVCNSKVMRVSAITIPSHPEKVEIQVYHYARSKRACMTLGQSDWAYLGIPSWDKATEQQKDQLCQRLCDEVSNAAGAAAKKTVIERIPLLAKISGLHSFSKLGGIEKQFSELISMRHYKKGQWIFRQDAVGRYQHFVSKHFGLSQVLACYCFLFNIV